MSVVNLYTQAGANTWTQPVGTTEVEAGMIGGGGGGGSGCCGAASENRSGGSGAQGGMYNWNAFPASILGGTETVTVGAGGAGGTSVTTESAGVDGVAGGNTTFGNWLKAGGGVKGQAGPVPPSTTAAAVTANVGVAESISGNGGAGNSTAGGSGTTFGTSVGSFAAGSAGGGGGISSANAVTNGGNNSNFNAATNLINIGGLGGGASAPTNPTVGQAYIWMPTGGAGGAGGAALANGVAPIVGSISTPGGGGSKYGGGGGGGAASALGFASGAGGYGADGVCLVVAH